MQAMLSYRDARNRRKMMKNTRMVRERPTTNGRIGKKGHGEVRRMEKEREG